MTPLILILITVSLACGHETTLRQDLLRGRDSYSHESLTALLPSAPVVPPPIKVPSTGGLTSVLPTSGLPKTLPTSGLTSTLPTSGLTSALPTSGLPKTLPTSGLTSALPTSGLSSALPTGLTSLLPSSPAATVVTKPVFLLASNAITLNVTASSTTAMFIACEQSFTPGSCTVAPVNTGSLNGAFNDNKYVASSTTCPFSTQGTAFDLVDFGTFIVRNEGGKCTLNLPEQYNSVYSTPLTVWKPTA